MIRGNKLRPLKTLQWATPKIKGKVTKLMDSHNPAAQPLKADLTRAVNNRAVNPILSKTPALKTLMVPQKILRERYADTKVPLKCTANLSAVA